MSRPPLSSFAARVLLAAAAGLAVAAAGPPVARAQSRPAAGAGAPGAAAGGDDASLAPEKVEVSPDSPRASLAAFFAFAGQGRWADAGRYLDLPASRAADAPRLARRLKAVLDRWAWVDLNLISPASSGTLTDGLPRDVEEIARVPGVSASPEPVHMVRVGRGDDARWAFSRRTLQRVDGWFERLPGAWLHDFLPEPLLRMGPRGLLYWQWLALPLLLVVAWLLGRVLGWITRRALAPLAARTTTRSDDLLLARLAAPLTAAWAIAALYLLLPALGLYRPAEAFIGGLMRSGFLLIFFWSLLRTVDVAGEVVAGSESARARPALAGLVPLTVRVVKIAIVAVATVTVLSQLGYPVASLLAGLGLGGLVLALAAQKTVENLFGSVSIGVDQPFRAGDFVRVDDTLGTVEQVGLRSTRIRTLDRTVVTIPNGQLADKRIENFGVRDRFRLACTLGLVYATSPAQLRAVLADLEAALRAHPKLWPDALVVRLKELGSSSLDIEIMAWFLAADFAEFQAIRQEVLLEFLTVVERNGTAIAFPTRTVHMVEGRQAA